MGTSMIVGWSRVSEGLTSYQTAWAQGLTAQERAELPELDMSDDAHRAWLGDIFAQHGGHTMDEAMLQRFYEAQLTWDETMAAKVHEHLQGAPEGQVVVLAGSGHVVWGYGVPNRLKRRLGEGADAQVMTIIPITPGGPEPATEAALARWREKGFRDQGRSHGNGGSVVGARSRAKLSIPPAPAR